MSKRWISTTESTYMPYLGGFSTRRRRTARGDCQTVMAVAKCVRPHMVGGRIAERGAVSRDAVVVTAAVAAAAACGDSR